MKTRLLLCALLLSVLASAQTYTESILYNFTSTEAVPNGLVKDSAGNLYGTTGYGESTLCSQNGCGLVYKLSTKNVFTVLHTFTGTNGDGAVPLAALTIDKSGNLYGTTYWGGLGYGTVFKITAAGKYSILHKFGRVSGDGLYPGGPVTLDSAGNMYGSTIYGGVPDNGGTCYTNGCGTIYKVTPKGVESVLYKFTGGVDGGFPYGNVIRDSKGNFYGTDEFLFYEVTNGVASTLYDFSSGTTPIPSYIVRSATGAFYGPLSTTSSVTGEIWQYVNGIGSNLSFSSNYDGIDTSGPIIVSGGNVIGTAYEGGAYWTSTCGSTSGSVCGGGTVYQFNPTTGVATALYSFPDPSSGSTDANTPNSGVIMDSSGNLYGTTNGGGTLGFGTVFKLTKN